MSQYLTKRMFADIPIFECGIVDSTQSIANNLINTGEIVELIQNPNLSAIVTATHQLEGRGRRDRVWQSEELSSFIWTFIVPRREKQDQAKVRSIVTSIVQVLNAQSLNVKIKWPNDIVVEVDNRIKKLGGVLTEVQNDFLIIGVGINLRSSFFNDDISSSAISLEEIGFDMSEEDTLNSVIDLILHQKSDETFVLYKTLLATLGQDVRVEMLNRVVEGKATDVDFDGTLTIDSLGNIVQVSEGDVIHLRNH